MRTLRWSFVVVLSTLAVLACSRSHPTTTASPVLDAVAVDSLILEVENHNWSDIVVFVTHDGVVSRLTQVTANANTKLRIWSARRESSVCRCVASVGRTASPASHSPCARDRRFG
jgi:hypothetical protein